MRTIVFFLMAAIMISACDRKEKMMELVETNLRQTLDNPDCMKILAMSEPDSAFGTHYFSQDEMKGMLVVMQEVTNEIMERTDNMTSFNPEDRYVMDMAERQMKAMSEMRSMVRQASRKGKWSGWKVKVDYQCKNNNGIDYKAERWFFLDKDGNAIFSSFELPLPLKSK